MSKFEPCPGATSDHAWRSVRVDFVDPQASSNQKFGIQCATWNMQGKCISKADSEKRTRTYFANHFKGLLPAKFYGNNPMDISENQKEYIKRKETQLAELKNIINAGNDIILLQEADWVLTPNNNDERQTLKAKFVKMLEAHHYGIITTPGKAHQLLVTLYNKNKLEPHPLKKAEGLFKSEQSKKFRGDLQYFVHKDSKKELAVANLHLEYGVDYQKKMLLLQEELAKKNIPCILGGDTNNIQDDKLGSMIGDRNTATNIEAANSGKGFTTVHQDKEGQKMQKTYDGFFVNPGLTTYAQITEKKGTGFIDQGNGVVHYGAYEPNEKVTKYETEIGKPW